MFLTQHALRFRREHVDLFQRGNYIPLRTSGSFADCCVAFSREHEGRWIIALTTRLSSRIGFPPVGERWKDTSVDLPENLSLQNVSDIFTGRELKIDGRQLKTAEAMSILPFAVITNYG
jgi:(1->4)-alpha-D-glucan 1-alpha-D-glucosylmutase